MNKYIRTLFFAASDVITLSVTSMAVAYLYRLAAGGYELSIYLKLWPACIIFVAINEIAKLYQGSLFQPGITFGPPEELRRLTYSISAVFLFTLAFMFISKSSESYSRFVILFSWLLCILSVPMARWVVRSALKPYAFGEIPAIILGAGSTGEKTMRLLKKSKYLGIKPVAFLDDSPKKIGQTIGGVKVMGSLSQAERVARRFDSSFAIICMPPQCIKTVMEEHCSKFSQMLIIPDKTIFSTAWTYTYDIGGMLGLELRRTLLLKRARALKFLVDMSLSILALLALSPLMAVITLLIRCTSKGPILYRAVRIGRDGREFHVYKFRTMKIDADKELERILEENPAMKMEWNRRFKLRNDPRITFIGKILRRTSLDELPQLFNVIRGEMSLIGPRPIVNDELPYFKDRIDTILKVKPGITGLWQVSGRTDTSYAERVDLDVYYIMNWNLWLDAFILMKTVKEVIFCRGAY